MEQTNKEKFIEIYNSLITRDGAKELLAWLESDKCDFFTAPASTRYHGNYEGGLVDHSLAIFECLKDYLSRGRVKEVYGLQFSDETIAISALLHDICKTNLYKKSFRNVKDDSGVWQKVPSYEHEDKLPYGHGEKSVYIISGFMRLTRDEAFAIRYHMGFSGSDPVNNVGSSFEKFPLAFALSTADMEATYFIDQKI